MLIDDKTFFLCPNCLKDIPMLFLSLENNTVNLNFICQCKTKDKSVFPLRNYLIKLNDLKTQAKPKCSKPEHSLGTKATKYCSNCSLWLCSDCLTNHQFHGVYNTELHLLCKLHKQAYSHYCHQCSQSICSNCKSTSHIKHNTDEVKNDPSILRHFNQAYTKFNTVLNLHKEYNNKFNERIDEEIRKLQQWKSEVNDLYEINERINTQLNTLCTILLDSHLFFNVPNYALNKTIEGIKVREFKEVLQLQEMSIQECYMNLKQIFMEDYIIELKDSVKANLLLIDNRRLNRNKRNVNQINKGTYGCVSMEKAHDKAIYCIYQIQDGRLVSSSLDNTMLIWDLSLSQRQGMLLKGHDQPVLCMTQLEDLRFISGSRDKTIKIWNMNTLKCISTLISHTNNVNSLTPLINGKLASAAEDKIIHIWDMIEYKTIATIKGHSDGILSIIQLEDERIVSGSIDRSIRVWNGKDYSLLYSSSELRYPICTLIQLIDRKLASGSSDCMITIWNIEGAIRRLFSLKGHTNSIYSIVQLDDERLVSASSDQSIRLWDLNTRSCIRELTQHKDSVYCIILLQDGRLCSGSWDKKIGIWDV